MVADSGIEPTPAEVLANLIENLIDAKLAESRLMQGVNVFVASPSTSDAVRRAKLYLTAHLASIGRPT